MTSQQFMDKKNKTLGENLIVILLIAVLMSSFIYYFFKHEQRLLQTGFASIAHVFASRVNAIHGQWYMDLKPSIVIIKENSSAKGKRSSQKVPVNSSGWVDVASGDETEGKGESPACREIWRYVTSTPMIYMKQPVSAVVLNIQGENNKVTRLCQYYLPSGEYFEYQPKQGKVSQVSRH